LKILSRLLLVVLLIAGVVFVNTSASQRDIIDYLPEVQMAKSHQVLGSSLGNASQDDFLECFDHVIEGAIADHLLYNENGQPYAPHEQLQIAVDAYCFAILSITADPSIISILEGETARVVNEDLMAEGTGELIIDGSKQSIRAAISVFAPSFLVFDLRGVEDFFGLIEPILDDDDPCAQLEEWVSDGPTFELKYTAFNTLRLDQQLGQAIFFGEIRCTQIIDEETDTLIAETKSRDFDAAVALSRFWTAELNTFLYTVDEDDELVVKEDLTLEEVQSEIERFEILIVENTQRYPLLTLAATYPLVVLYSIEAELVEENTGEAQ